MTKSLVLALALAIIGSSPTLAHADEAKPEYAYFYGGPYGGTCGAGCGGIELFFYKPTKSGVIDFFGGSGGVTKAGGISPLIDLRLGMNIAHISPTQHVQLGFTGGAYFLGPRTAAEDESSIGAAGGIEAAYSLRFGKIHIRPLLRAQLARGEVAAENGATGVGKGRMILTEVQVVVPLAKHFLVYGHVGLQSVKLTGEVKGMGDATYKSSAPVVTLGFAI